VTLLRLGPQQPNKVVLKIVEPEDDIHCVAWSYDPIRLMPLITFAGRKGLIYVWRLSLEPGQGAERFRVLRGHGEVRLIRPASRNSCRLTRVWVALVACLAGDLQLEVSPLEPSCTSLFGCGCQLPVRRTPR
jgi:hypothetical protein